MKETPRRRSIMVTSSLNVISTVQQGIRVAVREVLLLSSPMPPQCTAEPELLNFYGAPESIPRNQFRQPMYPSAWRAGTTTLFLLGAPLDCLKISAQASIDRYLKTTGTVLTTPPLIFASRTKVFNDKSTNVFLCHNPVFCPF